MDVLWLRATGFGWRFESNFDLATDKLMARVLEFRNAVRNADGTFDVEINHPMLGWVPFTASPVDCEAHGREIHAQLSEAEEAPQRPG